MFPDFFSNIGDDDNRVVDTESYTQCCDFSWAPTNVPEWDIPVSKDMDGDEFVQRLIEMDRAEFWNQAAEILPKTEFQRGAVRDAVNL